MPYTPETIGFDAKTSINRKDSGLTWKMALETGGILVRVLSMPARALPGRMPTCDVGWLSILADTAGEFSINWERSDAKGVGARFIAPWGGVGPTTEPVHRIRQQYPCGGNTPS
jgi:hypothetical protein